MIQITTGLNQWKWYAHRYKRKYYAERAERLSTGRVVKIKMHRLILNTPKGILGDHHDRDSLNNQRENLRNCNHAQNVQNRTSWGKSKYTGVCICRGKFRAYIHNNHVKINLGIYVNEIDAAKAYDKKAKEMFGEFANLNFK